MNALSNAPVTPVTTTSKVDDAVGVKKMRKFVAIVNNKSERQQHIVTLPYINRFMSNQASNKDRFGKHPIAVIPDDQIERLKFILGHADTPVEFEPTTFKLGNKVRVIRGGLVGAEGHVIECGDDTYFAIRVDFLEVTKVKIQKEYLNLC